MFRQRFFISSMPQLRSSRNLVSIEYTILVLAVPKRPKLEDAVPSSGKEQTPDT